MGGANSRLQFPKHTPLGFHNTNPTSKKEQRSMLNRQNGVTVVAQDLKNSPAYTDEAKFRPHSRIRPTLPTSGPKGRPQPVLCDRRGNPLPLLSQMDPEVVQLLLDLEQENLEWAAQRAEEHGDLATDAYMPGYWKRRNLLINRGRRVWEIVPATPLIIDFTNVKEPLFPTLTHPSSGHSRHPDRPFYAAVMEEARRRYPEAAQRDMHYWERMDSGDLPADFNPYPPGTDKHNAFMHRTVLIDDRPTMLSKDPTRPGRYANQEVLATPRQVRSRARRKADKGLPLSDEEFEIIFTKPVEEWTMEELARGYPRTPAGAWPPRPPSQYLQMEIRERVDKLFKERVKSSMNESTITAVKTLSDVLTNEDIDSRGRPVVSASTKVDAAKFLVEHLLGKPKQIVQEDISIKLQGILASVMVAPEMAPPDPTNPQRPISSTGRMLAGQRGAKGNYEDTELLALTQAGYVDAEVVSDTYDDDDHDDTYDEG